MEKHPRETTGRVVGDITSIPSEPHSVHMSALRRFLRCFWIVSALGIAAAMARLPESQAAESKPNVVFILADDLGWSDTTLFGTTKFYRTPHIERLAARGMTFTRAYSSSPLCSPTRASVLTGLSPASHGITSPNCHTPKVVLKATETASGPPNRFSTVPDSVSRLGTSYYTLAEMLRDHGYATGHFGKWHLGTGALFAAATRLRCRRTASPRSRGPAGSYVAPWKFKDFDHDPDIPDETSRRPHGQGSGRIHGTAPGRTVLPELLDVQRACPIRRQAIH